MKCKKHDVEMLEYTSSGTDDWDMPSHTTHHVCPLCESELLGYKVTRREEVRK